MALCTSTGTMFVSRHGERKKYLFFAPMSERKLVTMRQVSSIDPIAGADQIEVATVDGWKCVVKKGEFKVGDMGVYHEIDSLLPMIPLYEFLKNKGTKKMMVEGIEKEGYRLRTIKLKGQLSQGLLLPLKSVQEALGSKAEELVFDGEHGGIAELLGVIKYEAPIPPQLSGQVEGMFPSFIHKTDQERVQNLTEEIKRFQGMQFEITEKLDGSSMTVYLKDGHFGVCSRNLELKETEGSTQWKLAREMDLETKLRFMFERDKREYAIQGEVIGEGVQGNPYNRKGHSFHIFDIFDITEGRYLMPGERITVLTWAGLLQCEVPVISNCTVLHGGTNQMLTLAEGKSLLADVEREGIVLKSHFLVNNAPFTFKAISNNFLLNNEE